jgi:hypothetical protein
MSFCDAKYDVIGRIPRDRLKMMSLRSTPLLWMDLLRVGETQVYGLPLTLLRWTVRKPVQKHPLHSFFARCVCVRVWWSW